MDLTLLSLSIKVFKFEFSLSLSVSLSLSPSLSVFCIVLCYTVLWQAGICIHEGGSILCCVLLYCGRPESVFIRVVAFCVVLLYCGRPESVFIRVVAFCVVFYCIVAGRNLYLSGW